MASVTATPCFNLTYISAATAAFATIASTDAATVSAISSSSIGSSSSAAAQLDLCQLLWLQAQLAADCTSAGALGCWHYIWGHIRQYIWRYNWQYIWPGGGQYIWQ
jgi:hypothetical protein